MTGPEGTPREWPDSTVHLGHFDRVTANRIAGDLEAAGIWWWYKEPGFFSQIWEVGVRLFVDRERLDEAKDIVDRIRREGPAEEEDVPPDG